MQIEAIYSNGKLEFQKSVRFLNKRFKVKVEVPDEEVAVDNNSAALPSSRPRKQTLRSPIDLLLADRPDDPWLMRMKGIEEQVLSLPEEELPELTPKQLQYLEAFASREDR